MNNRFIFIAFVLYMHMLNANAKDQKKNLALQRFTLKKTKLLQIIFFSQCLALFSSKLINLNNYIFNRNILLFLKFINLEDNNYNHTIFYPLSKKMTFSYFYFSFFISLKMFSIWNLNFSGYSRQKYQVQTRRKKREKSSSQLFFSLRVDTAINLELCIRYYSIFFVQVGH